MGFWKLKIHAAKFNIGQCFWAQGEYALGHNDITYNSKTPPTLPGKWPEGPSVHTMLEYGGGLQQQPYRQTAIYSVDKVQFVALGCKYRRTLEISTHTVQYIDLCNM